MTTAAIEAATRRSDRLARQPRRARAVRRTTSRSPAATHGGRPRSGERREPATGDASHDAGRGQDERGDEADDPAEVIEVVEVEDQLRKAPMTRANVRP